jgi:hypothetical protein
MHIREKKVIKKKGSTLAGGIVKHTPLSTMHARCVDKITEETNARLTLLETQLAILNRQLGEVTATLATSLDTVLLDRKLELERSIRTMTSELEGLRRNDPLRKYKHSAGRLLTQYLTNSYDDVTLKRRADADDDAVNRAKRRHVMTCLPVEVPMSLKRPRTDEHDDNGNTTLLGKRLKQSDTDTDIATDTTTPTTTSRQSNDNDADPKSIFTIAGSRKSILDTYYQMINTHNNAVASTATPVATDTSELGVSTALEPHIIGDSTIPTSLRNVGAEMCPDCGHNRTLIASTSTLVCDYCGAEDHIQSDQDTKTYKEQPREIFMPQYKRGTHFNEWLGQLQGRPAACVTEEVIDKIKAELKKEWYLKESDITPSKIKDVLRKLNMTTKFNEHCFYILYRITNRPAPKLDDQLLTELRRMFKEIQVPWQLHRPNTRHNFFSYPYVFYKFCERLGRKEYLPICRELLLKGPDKLNEHDNFWAKICKSLNWKFIRTDPHGML